MATAELLASADGDGATSIEHAATALQRIVALRSGAERLAFSEEERVALGALYRLCAPRALRRARRYAASDSDALDVVHDVFLQLPSFIQHYRSGNFFAWFGRAIERAAIRARRRTQKECGLDDVAAPNADVDFESSKAAALQLRSAVERLPAGLRAVVLLRTYGEHSHSEIGRRLGISISASEVRFCRAIKRLRHELQT